MFHYFNGIIGRQGTPTERLNMRRSSQYKQSSTASEDAIFFIGGGVLLLLVPAVFIGITIVSYAPLNDLLGSGLLALILSLIIASSATSLVVSLIVLAAMGLGAIGFGSAVGIKHGIQKMRRPRASAMSKK